jgi:hypothetical protein
VIRAPSGPLLAPRARLACDFVGTRFAERVENMTDDRPVGDPVRVRRAFAHAEDMRSPPARHDSDASHGYTAEAADDSNKLHALFRPTV